MNNAWLLLWAAAISTSAVNAQAGVFPSPSINGSAQDNGPFAFATMAGKHSPASSNPRPGELSHTESAITLVQSWFFQKGTRWRSIQSKPKMDTCFQCTACALADCQITSYSMLSEQTLTLLDIMLSQLATSIKLTCLVCAMQQACCTIAACAAGLQRKLGQQWPRSKPRLHSGRRRL